MVCLTSRSSHWSCSVKKAVPKNFVIFTIKHLCWSLSSIKLQQACNFIKRRLQDRCFPVNIAKILKTPILKNSCKRLLLNFLLFFVWLFFRFGVHSYFIVKCNKLSLQVKMLWLFVAVLRTVK